MSVMTPLGNPRLRPALLVAVALALSGVTLAAPPATRPAGAAPAGSVHLPDLRTVIPDDGFSIEAGPDGPEFRYTHLVHNAGAGPLRIQPAYSTTAGTYLGQQQLTTHDSSGDWSVVSARRVADDFRYHAEHGHFHFPLARFGLYRVATDGGPGAAVTMSPKVGFCISDSYIYDASLPHAGVGHDLWGSCSDPTSMRGIAVGGADEYDYRDPGQAIPMTGVPDGTYWFRAESDPNDDFVESDESNNETDVKVRIADGEVTPLRPAPPDTTPCRTTLGGVGEGDLLAGTVPLSASTSVGRPGPGQLPARRHRRRLQHRERAVRLGLGLHRRRRRPALAGGPRAHRRGHRLHLAGAGGRGRQRLRRRHHGPAGPLHRPRGRQHGRRPGRGRRRAPPTPAG